VSKLNYMSNRVTALIIAVLVLSGCTVIDVDIGFTPDAELTKRVLVLEADEFPEIIPLYLNDEVKNYVDRVINRKMNPRRKLELLRSMLFDDEYLSIDYSDQYTQTAVEVFESRAGNCLSVINLYIAMARYVGVDANFQTVQVRPAWDRRGSLFVLSQHVNATGKVSQRNTYIVDFTPAIALQQLTSKIVTDSHARALYFVNLGVEQMIAGDFESALLYLQNALWINPELSIGWNNIGTAYKRLGDLELAEYSYQMAFKLDQTNATAINNLARYYNAQGEEELASTYRRAITRFSRKNPYYHFNLGNTAYQSGSHKEAIRHYRRAIRIKELEPEFYLALARVYSQIGNDRMQNQMISEANEMLAENLEIYQPSDQKIRFIDELTIMRSTSAGLSIIAH